MDETDIIIDGEIILEGDVLPHEYCEWMEGACFSARLVRAALSRLGGDVTIRVNSPGGSPHEGEAIRAAIEAHPGHVTVVIGGLAASAASLMIMSADRIEMTAGSFLMVHNPSVCVQANAAELRRHADDLDGLAQAYAGIYAARSGQPVAEILRLMNAETYFSAAQAVEIGLADAVAGPAASQLTVVAASAMHGASLARLRMCAEHFHPQPVSGGGSPAAPAATPPAASAATMLRETHMPNEEIEAGQAPAGPATPPATPAPAPQVSMQAPDTSAAERRGAEAERARIRGIRDMAAPFMSSGQLTLAQIDALIDEGVPLAAAGNRLMTVMAAAESPVAPRSGGQARITRDEGDTEREGLIGALMRNYEGPGAQFRGMRLRGLAMHLAGANRGYSELDSIQRGMRSVRMTGGAHGVSDFAFITTEVMNRSLMAEYDRRGSGWRVVTGEPLEASDFRELHAVRFGGDFQLKTVKENGEYQEATLNDEAEGLKVERRGRTINLTFEAVVNDDMSAFNRIPREFAMAARVMESSMVWGLIRSNAVLKSDSKALFHADHGNLGSGGAAAVISAASVGAGRKAMWGQTAFGSKDVDDFLQITPDQLIVPPALEVTALQFATATVPTKDSDSNPYKGTLTPVTVPHLGASAGGSDTAWYLVSSDLPPISVAYLEGYGSPTVQTIEGMNPDKVTMHARHIFGAAPSEYRGAYKNNGA